MAIKINFLGMTLQKPGHYGPLCTSCRAPIMFNQIRKLETGKCDKCNSFKIHNCYQSPMYDPNVMNPLNDEFWSPDGTTWYGELQNAGQGENPIFTLFEVRYCPFCGEKL